ncbi:MAG: ABC transporter permease [Gammaproteobacteria bacterium]|nr:ABC transporter permease [Gammaproteobacteria bacterium]
MRILRFSLLGLWREWRSGELRLLSFSLILAVAAVTSVGFFTDRVEQALQQQGNELLAADLVIESSNPLPEEFNLQAAAEGLEMAQTLSFPSVVMVRDEPQLVQVKAVSAGYPLRGELLIRELPESPIVAAERIPQPGRVWVEPRLLLLLDLHPGDSLSLGERRFSIERLIELEPDRGGNLFQLAPRVMIDLQDIPSTGLVSAASRVKHRLLLAGPPSSVARFRDWSEPRLPDNARILSISDARPELRNALERGSRFLALAALVTVLVTGAAVALSTRRLVERQSDAVAVMRCLGAQSSFLRNSLILRLLLLILLTGLAGALAGYLAQIIITNLLSDWLTQSLPPPSPRPLLTGLATGAITLFGFALPPLMHLPKVSPLKVLRRDLGVVQPGPWLLGLSALSALGLLIYWEAGEPRMALTLLSGVVVLLLLLSLLALLLIRLAGKLQQRARGIQRFGLASLSRHPGTTLLQVCGFGLGIMAILLLAVVRVDLLSAWEDSLPAGAPNRFLVNILPEQIAELETFLAQNRISNSGLHPMIRGRLSQINDQPVIPENYANPRARGLASREFNLSWGIQLQSDNQIIAGAWWQEENAAPQFSVDKGIAETLGIELGDRLTYSMGDRSFSAPVTSLRTVKWDSFNVNFFVIGSPATLRDEAATYITSFHLEPTQEKLAADLIKRFPNVTLLDVTAILQQVRRVMDRGSAAVEYIFLFTLAAGLLVLYAGILAGAEARSHESAILRTLGAARKQLLGAAAIEFATLGLLAGLLASLGAFITGQLLAQQIFQLEYGFSLWLWLGGVGGATLGIGLAGLFSAWPLVVRPPIQSLRQTE